VDTEPLPPKRGRLTLIFLAVVAAGFLVSVLVRREPSVDAPRLELTLFDGTEFVLARQDQPVIINFWASWCTPCRREIPALIAFWRRHPELLVLGVATDDTDTAARAFAAEMGIDYPAGLDESGAIADAFGVPGLPVTIAVDEQGRIVRRVFGEVGEAELEDLAAAVG
jgi:thiol-disulfide isomerase/thioredoxin